MDWVTWYLIGYALSYALMLAVGVTSSAKSGGRVNVGDVMGWMFISLVPAIFSLLSLAIIVLLLLDHKFGFSKFEIWRNK